MVQNYNIMGRKKYQKKEDYAVNIQFYVSGPNVQLLGGRDKVKTLLEKLIAVEIAKKKK